jgi:hypothetical protein
MIATTYLDSLMLMSRGKSARQLRRAIKPKRVVQNLGSAGNKLFAQPPHFLVLAESVE